MSIGLNGEVIVPMLNLYQRATSAFTSPWPLEKFRRTLDTTGALLLATVESIFSDMTTCNDYFRAVSGYRLRLDE